VFKYAGVIVNNTSVQVDKIFTYSVPEKLRDSIQIGHRVSVPFGMGNKKIDGFVINLQQDYEASTKVKEISEICDDYPLLRPSDLEIIDYMRRNYLCTYLECIKTIIPTGITKGLVQKTSNVIYAAKELNGKYVKEPYMAIYDLLIKNDGKLSKSEFAAKFGISISSINTLIKHGFITQDKIVVNRYDNRSFESYSPKTLNNNQRNAIDQIINSSITISLIHGVTGSGKTEIYMNLVDMQIQKGSDSIILVPEISLTPQMVERFKGRFGKNIAVFHSKLSEGERFDEWLRVKAGNVKVAIGARSAVFLPFNNLGLIIIDEEHENSYKSDSDPKYRAAEIAELRCYVENSKLVLGSATPSVETYFRAKMGEIQLITISDRADNASLPEIKLVDMREELSQNNKSIFSRELFQEIKLCLEREEQVILFLNRRGYSPFVSCRNCGYVFKCDRCDISMTYHSDTGDLCCHYCGDRRKVTNTCPKCKSKYVKYFGVGTEKIEHEVKKYFPTARTLRMDFDTTRRKNSYEHIYNSFKNNQADILIGTQMIAKGLDFKDVTLVGVIAADLSLNLPDFRSAEKTFQLVTQVGGRAGRGKKAGKVIVQTYSPESYSIKFSVENDYISFYNHEIAIRKDMEYPPFTKILSVNISSKNEDLLIKNIQNIGSVLKNMSYNKNGIEMLGPCPCAVSKINDFYRWQIVFKGKLSNDVANNIKNTVYDLLKDVYTEIRVSLDINPNSLL
jgi:primosomal protein N' (replication factor Y)